MIQEKSKIEETPKKHILVSEVFHKQLKLRSVKKGTTIEEEINKILKREFNDKRLKK